MISEAVCVVLKLLSELIILNDVIHLVISYYIMRSTCLQLPQIGKLVHCVSSTDFKHIEPVDLTVWHHATALSPYDTTIN